jgi:hypothetical protein
MSSPVFSAPILLSGPVRHPAQLLHDQEYDGHASIHDESVAAGLGFASGAIEGAVHLSQFDPLLLTLWGERWFRTGCISVHFVGPCIEGEGVRAFVECPHEGSEAASIRMEKDDGSLVLSGTASVSSDVEQSEARTRMNRLREVGRLQILEDVHVGDRVPTTTVRMDLATKMGALYPFSLEEKLAVITEPLSYYQVDSGQASPWGAAIVPTEMVSVLFQYIDNKLPVREPSVGLFMDQEIRYCAGPVLVGTDYQLERSIVALGETRRTESYWLESVLSDDSGATVATGLLHVGFFKDSFPGYIHPEPLSDGGQPSSS